MRFPSGKKDVFNENNDKLKYRMVQLLKLNILNFKKPTNQ